MILNQLKNYSIKQIPEDLLKISLVGEVIS